MSIPPLVFLEPCRSEKLACDPTSAEFVCVCVCDDVFCLSLPRKNPVPSPSATLRCVFDRAPTVGDPTPLQQVSLERETNVKVTRRTVF